MEEEQSYFSGYPEDIKVHKKAAKHSEFLEQYSPLNGGEDFEDQTPDRYKPWSIEHPIEKEDILFNKKVEVMQSNPIKLTDSAAGTRSFEKEFNEKPE